MLGVKKYVGPIDLSTPGVQLPMPHLGISFVAVEPRPVREKIPMQKARCNSTLNNIPSQYRGTLFAVNPTLSDVSCWT